MTGCWTKRCKRRFPQATRLRCLQTSILRSRERAFCASFISRCRFAGAVLSLPMNGSFPPDPGVRPAALNAGFAPHSRRSDAYGFTSQIDPQPTLGINSTDFG